VGGGGGGVGGGGGGGGGGGAFCVGLQTTDTPRKDGSCGCLISECFIIQCSSNSNSDFFMAINVFTFLYSILRSPSSCSKKHCME